MCAFNIEAHLNSHRNLAAEVWRANYKPSPTPAVTRIRKDRDLTQRSCNLRTGAHHFDGHDRAVLLIFQTLKANRAQFREMNHPRQLSQTFCGVQFLFEVPS